MSPYPIEDQEERRTRGRVSTKKIGFIHGAIGRGHVYQILPNRYPHGGAKDLVRDVAENPERALRQLYGQENTERLTQRLCVSDEESNQKVRKDGQAILKSPAQSRSRGRGTNGRTDKVDGDKSQHPVIQPVKA